MIQPVLNQDHHFIVTVDPLFSEVTPVGRKLCHVLFLISTFTLATSAMEQPGLCGVYGLASTRRASDPQGVPGREA